MNRSYSVRLLISVGGSTRRWVTGIVEIAASPEAALNIFLNEGGLMGSDIIEKYILELS